MTARRCTSPPRGSGSRLVLALAVALGTAACGDDTSSVSGTGDETGSTSGTSLGPTSTTTTTSDTSSGTGTSESTSTPADSSSSTGVDTSSTGGDTSTSSGGGESSSSGTDDTTGGAVASGQSVDQRVGAGVRTTSASYSLVFTLGQPSQLQATHQSPSYRLQGGLIGANGSPP